MNIKYSYKLGNKISLLSKADLNCYPYLPVIPIYQISKLKHGNKKNVLLWPLSLLLVQRVISSCTTLFSYPKSSSSSSAAEYHKFILFTQSFYYHHWHSYFSVPMWNIHNDFGINDHLFGDRIKACENCIRHRLALLANLRNPLLGRPMGV